jgi:hypothetical protein
VDRDVRDREKASDHAPAWIELAEVTKASPVRARRPQAESRDDSGRSLGTGLPNFANPFSILRTASFRGRIELTAGNKCILAAMIASGSRKRVKQPRRSSRRNYNSPSNQFQKSLPTADHPARKPRILAISPATSIGREAVETPVSLNQQTVRGILVSQLERVRTWVKYGMTVPQVTQFYGVAVEEVKRILRKV